MMGYWKDTYGQCSREFIDGVKVGVSAYAMWKNGKQLVGVMRVPIEEVFAKIEEELGGGTDGSKTKGCDNQCGQGANREG